MLFVYVHNLSYNNIHTHTTHRKQEKEKGIYLLPLWKDHFHIFIILLFYLLYWAYIQWKKTKEISRLEIDFFTFFSLSICGWG